MLSKVEKAVHKVWFKELVRKKVPGVCIGLDWVLENRERNTDGHYLQRLGDIGRECARFVSEMCWGLGK